MGIRNRFWYLILLMSATLSAQELSETYVEKWKKFYPSKALKSGIREAVFQYENRSKATVLQWIAFNENTLHTLLNDAIPIDAIDARLLRVQAQSELDIWKSLSRHENSLRHYSRLISNALPSVFKSDFLLAPEQSDILCQRLDKIKELCHSAQSNLKAVSKKEMENGMRELSEAVEYIQTRLSDDLKSNGVSRTCSNFDTNYDQALISIASLQHFVRTTLAPEAKDIEAVLGLQEYNRQLQLYTDSNLTAKKLAEMALSEIETVKDIMVGVSKNYLKATYPDEALPSEALEIIKKALADMEKDAPKNSTDYLQFWQELADAAVAFIKEKDIATLPKNQTLRIQTAPESAGAAARIGWVASAPPFDPNPMTTLNLPSIPNTLPQQEQIDFWASFNKPFNRMIVIHELFPGHYMQLKISRETPHPLRMLFPYGIYIEGWATFTEKVLLDAGWEEGQHLTLLAHLRKRLENANRSYTSVQVHCNGWNKEQVMSFSTKTALVAPQFAKSLWGRIMNSPLQLTSYYLGGAQFTELLKSEEQRLGDRFNLKLFMDTIMKAGPIPIEEFYPIFEESIPN